MQRFQNTNPERGRKLRLAYDGRPYFRTISEHEPRKGTETFLPHINESFNTITISEHEPRKGTETTAN